MAMIHVNRNREALGKFTDHEVAEGLKNGRFLPSDLAWKDPMPTWEPLSSFNDLPEASADEEKPEAVEIPVEPLAEPVWEREKGISIPAAIGTAKQIFEKPAATFAGISPTGGIRRAFVFFLILSWFCGTVSVGYECLAAWINPNSLLEGFAQFPEPARKELQTWFDTQGHKNTILLVFASSFVLQPLVLIARIFVFSLLAHLFLLLVGARIKNFTVTFKALAYSSGTAATLQIFPIVGSLLGVIGSLVLGFIALKKAHGVSGWHVTLAAFLVMMVACGLLVLLTASLVTLAQGVTPAN